MVCARASDEDDLEQGRAGWVLQPKLGGGRWEVGVASLCATASPQPAPPAPCLQKQVRGVVSNLCDRMWPPTAKARLYRRVPPPPKAATHKQGLLRGGLHGTLLAQAFQDDGVGALGVEADGTFWGPDWRRRRGCPRWLPPEPACPPHPTPPPRGSPSTDMRLRTLLKSIMARTW